MRLLVTGAGGLLGRAVVEEARADGLSVTALGRTRLDVTDAARCHEVITAAAPDVVVHCAAYTDVDGAEAEEAVAVRVNRDGSRHVAEATLEAGAVLVYPSTDYVFDGRGSGPHRVDDPTAPMGAYGRSKLAGEEAVRGVGGRHLVVRTSWLYGAGGKNFVDTIRTLAATRDELRVVADQRGRPSWSVSVARTFLELLRADARGTLHACDSGSASWLELAEAVLTACGLSARLVPVTTAEWGAPAPRPANSVLDLGRTEALLGHALPHWTTSLNTYLERTA